MIMRAKFKMSKACNAMTHQKAGWCQGRLAWDFEQGEERSPNGEASQKLASNGEAKSKATPMSVSV